MFKKGDKVKMNPESIYFGGEGQLPSGVVGRVACDQQSEKDWISVHWGDYGYNNYLSHDLIKVNTFKGNK